MSKTVFGGYTLGFASIQGSQQITTDSIVQSDNGVNLTTQLDALEAGSGGGSSLTGNITIGTTSGNTITVNSGLTTYNNTEIIKLIDNTSGALRIQCNDAGPTDLMILSTTNGAEALYLPLKYTEIGNEANAGVQIGDAANVGTTNIYGVVSLKNATDSTAYTSTNCTNTPGGLSVYKNLNVGGNITANNITDATTSTDANSSLVVKGGIACAKRFVAANIVSDGNVYAGATVTATNFVVAGTTASGSTTTGALTCAGGVGIAGDINAGGTVTTTHLVSTGSVQGVGIASTGNIQAYANGIYEGSLTISGTTASTTNLTGAIICSGGMGISGVINSNSAINTPNSMSCGGFTNNGLSVFTNTSDSTSVLSGALYCYGGIGISKKNIREQE